MEAIVERCAGLDVHQATVVACLNIGTVGTKPTKQIRTFGTTLPELEELRDWLTANGCTLVAMESTGIYWVPVHAVLEDHFEIVVGNAQHIKNVPGRKTDVKDCDWISDLARHGLIAKSFVPPRPIRELRDLTRYRSKLVQAATAERNRLLKLLESANIKLSSVASDVFGVSGWAMLQALVEGKQTLPRWRNWRNGGCGASWPNWSVRCMAGWKSTTASCSACRCAGSRRWRPISPKSTSGCVRSSCRTAAKCTCCGRFRGSIGNRRNHHRRDRRRHECLCQFRASRLLASMCPGSYESAGKRRGGKTRKGNVHLKTALVLAARAAGKTKGTYLGDKYRRFRTRIGAARAGVAIGHKILVVAYRMLSDGTDYKDLGAGYLDQLNTHRTAGNLVRRLRQMGYDVQLTSKAA